MKNNKLYQYCENHKKPVLILGAGINGCALFRELALQKIPCLLIDKQDFSSGASAACSRMVHGGLRYLEQGEFSLVTEALTERNLLFRNAPHAVKPIKTSVPIFNWLSGFGNSVFKFLKLNKAPTARGVFIIKLGLVFYDWFARKYHQTKKHRFVWKAQAIKQHIGLHKNVIAIGEYSDGFVKHPERLAFELIQDAENEFSGARAFNYVEATLGRGCRAVELKDMNSLEVISIHSPIVVNTTGPWVDFTNASLGVTTDFIGGTKGSHIIVDNPNLKSAIGDHLFLYENSDGRVCVLIPYGNFVLVGTSDIRIDHPDQAECTTDEIDYFFQAVNNIFPDVVFSTNQIVAAFAGVRPLVQSNQNFTGSISRDHQCQLNKTDNQITIISMFGGKWTTFRSFAESGADMVLQELNLKRSVYSKNLAIGGGKSYPDNSDEFIIDLSKKFELSYQCATDLFKRYGTYSERIAEYISDKSEERLGSKSSYYLFEIEYLILNEKVKQLEDLILRRTLIAFQDEITISLLEKLAAMMGKQIGWSDKEVHQQLETTKEILINRYRIRNL